MRYHCIFFCTGALLIPVFFSFLDKPSSTDYFTYIKEKLTSSSITFTWKPGFNGGLQQTFVIQYKIVSDDLWFNVTVKDSQNSLMNYTLTSLSSGKDYVALLFAYNDIGASNIYGVVTFRTLNLEGKILT